MSFRYTITIRANQKDEYYPSEKSIDEFISKFLEMGVKAGEKDGSGIIGATFKPGTRLEQKNVEMVTALILDVDGKFKRDGVVTQEPVPYDDFIRSVPYRGIAHTSYNHTPGLPKYRVILPLDRAITTTEHRRLWYWVFDQIKRKCDPACKNSDRMFYLPRAPQVAIDQGWPWIRELRGKVLSIDEVPENYVPPVETHGEKPTGQYRRALYITSAPRANTERLLEAFMDSPIAHWAKTNPVAVSREVWRGIATNLAAIAKEEENNDELYQKCLDAFHEISSADPERYRHGDTVRAFADAMKSVMSYGPMTFTHMVENGFPEGLVDERSKTPITEIRRKIWNEGPVLPKSEAPTVPAVSAGATSPMPPPVPTAPKVPEIDPVTGEPVEEEPTGYNPNDFLFDAQNNLFMMRDHRENFSVESPTMRKEALDQLLRSSGYPMPKHREKFHAKIQSFHSRKAVYSSPGSTLVTAPNGFRVVLNTYQRTALVPKDPDPTPEELKIPPAFRSCHWPNVQALILNLAGDDPEAANYILDWLAAPIQSLINNGQPLKMGTALVFHGTPGGGKTMLHTIMEVIYGKFNVVSLSQDSLDSRFNDVLVDKLFVTANEVISSTNRSMETANKLKMWITDATISIEGKNKAVFYVDNNFNIMFTSNDDRPVIIERRDRRYSAFKSKALDRHVGMALARDLAGDKIEIASFYNNLLNRKINIKYGEKFNTIARMHIVRASLPSAESFVLDIAELGWLTVSAPWQQAGSTASPRQVTVDEDNAVIKETLDEVYQDYCKRNNLKAVNIRGINVVLEEHLPDVKKERRRVGVARPYVYTGIPMEVGEVIPITFAMKKDAPLNDVSDAGDFGA